MYKEYLAIGLMSGTSADGVDVSLIKTDGLNKIEVIKDGFIPYSKSLYYKINKLMLGFGNQFNISREITNKHIEAVKCVINADELLKTDIIGFHGQTINHKPESSYTLQIGDPCFLSYHLQTPVIFNFRERDILYGGQGAPLTPIYSSKFFIKFIRCWSWGCKYRWYI